MPLISTALDLRVLTPPPSSSSARPQAAVLSSLCREKMRREEGRAGKAEGASSPALSNLWELAPLITMTTGGGAAVSVAVAVTVGGQEIPLSDWLKGAGCLHCHPQQEVPNLRGLHVCSAQGRRAPLQEAACPPLTSGRRSLVSVSSLVLSGIWERGGERGREDRGSQGTGTLVDLPSLAPRAQPPPPPNTHPLSKGPPV